MKFLLLAVAQALAMPAQGAWSIAANDSAPIPRKNVRVVYPSSAAASHKHAQQSCASSPDTASPTNRGLLQKLIDVPLKRLYGHFGSEDTSLDHHIRWVEFMADRLKRLLHAYVERAYEHNDEGCVTKRKDVDRDSLCKELADSPRLKSALFLDLYDSYVAMCGKMAAYDSFIVNLSKLLEAILSIVNTSRAIRNPLRKKAALVADRLFGCKEQLRHDIQISYTEPCYIPISTPLEDLRVYRDFAVCARSHTKAISARVSDRLSCIPEDLCINPILPRESIRTLRKRLNDARLFVLDELNRFRIHLDNVQLRTDVTELMIGAAQHLDFYIQRKLKQGSSDRITHSTIENFLKCNRLIPDLLTIEDDGWDKEE
ncbi:hypothetical protein PAPHI01_1708 [Pancytospora philotis]|nr:hypothetical protein PAPHI01_1708 [Pancytospora philotis]